MTFLDVANECGLMSKSQAKRLAFKHVARLRYAPYDNLEPEEVERLRSVYRSEVNKLRGGQEPELPGLLPGPASRVFLFDKWRVRVALKNGKPWFVAKDVAEALGYAWNGTRNIEHIPAKWRGFEFVSTPSACQSMAILSLEGLFFFLNRSDKAAAQPFQEWVNGTVLVSIHETGEYKAPVGEKPEAPKLPKASPKIPAGVQLKELRLMTREGFISSRQLQRILGVEEPPIITLEEPPLSAAEAEARFRELRGLIETGESR
jgi:prophage antirepressor-like protein